MTFLPYLLLLVGIIIGGLAGFTWFKAKNTAQLITILNLIHNQPDHSPLPASSRPILSRLRSSAVQVNRQRQELEEELENWQHIWQAAPIGYMHISAENQILWCNAPAQEFLHINNWPADQNRLLLAVVRSFELDQLVNQTRQTQVGSELEWQFYPNYTDQPADGLATTLKAATVSLPQKSVGIFLENRQPIVAMNKARERWTTDLAHELRTPLTSIRLMAETIQGQLEPSLDRWSDRMLMEIDRLAKLVQGFLELSQLEETPHKHIKKQLVSLDHLIHDAWHSLEPLSNQQDIALQQLGDTGIKLSADPGRLAQVLINLFDNAIKYSQASSQVQVITHSQDRTVEIEIIDTGTGFATQDLPYVFDRLFRSDASRQQQQQSTSSSLTTGSGLGLAIVKQIILAHGGTVTAQNHPTTGQGCLKIKLPID
jgi:two-component system, OmpR family, phosphate regulon sensor histidine kinase PhoR